MVCIYLRPEFPFFTLVYFPILLFEFFHARVRENGWWVVKAWVLENHLAFVCKGLLAAPVLGTSL